MRLQPLLRHFVHLKIQIIHFRSSGKLRYSVRCSQRRAIVMLYRVVLTFESVDQILKCVIQVKATEQYFPVVLVNIMLYKVVLTLESANEILKCDHSNKCY